MRGGGITKFLVMVLALAGCSNLEKLAQEEPVEKGPAQDAKIIANAKRLCTKKYGYLPGSSAFEQCMEENALGLKREVQKTMEKDEMAADAKAECEKAGYPKESDAYFECVSATMDNMLRATAKKQRR